MDATGRGLRGRVARVSRWSPLLALALASAAAGETVELVPDRRASFGLTHLLAPITGLFLGGPGYWYDPRRLEVSTTPPGALLDLFYVRANMQRAYEQTAAPVTVLLPSRIEADARDSVTIRALADGYASQTVHVRVRSRTSRVEIDLTPLPNQLVRVGYVYFAERALLRLSTREVPSFRLLGSETGAELVLVGTALAPEAEAFLGELAGPLVSGIRTLQLGEDLVLRIASPGLASGLLELREIRRRDPVRRLHQLELQLAPSDRGARGVRRARDALARIAPGDVAGCALVFERSLRDALGAAELARALSVADPFLGPVLRAALRRLAELTGDGHLTLSDGTRHRGDLPLELEAAASRAAEARGVLALLRALVARLEPPEQRRATLRGLLAPELGAARFAAALASAEAGEQRCRAGS